MGIITGDVVHCEVIRTIKEGRMKGAIMRVARCGMISPGMQLTSEPQFVTCPNCSIDSVLIHPTY
jgi:hypothetical protein